MRDPERIDKIIELLRERWKLDPDWRLGQLIHNLLGTGKTQQFYVEDDQALAKLKLSISRQRGLRPRGEA